jgi:dihydrolipoamide dehydrogenase
VLRIGILGGGPAGYVGALRAAQLGASVTLIERRWLGGTCLHVGCIPTKTLVHAAGLYAELSAKGFRRSGLLLDNLRLDLEALRKRKDDTVHRLVTGIRGLLKEAGVELVEAEGRLEAPGVMTYRGDDGEVVVNSDYTLIATGSEPAAPPIPGIELAWTSEDALRFEEIPHRLLVIGAGVVGLEFASIYAAFGSRVTVVEMLERALPMEDAELGAELERQLKRAGITVHTGTRVLGLDECDGGFEAVFHKEGNGKDLHLECDRVLVATGRRPIFPGVDAEGLDLSVRNGAIVVDSRLRTTLLRTYAAGDCIGGHMLAHVASYEAETAVEHMVTERGEVEYAAVPRCVFTIPEVAAVGATEDDASETGQSVTVGRFPYRASGKALCAMHSEGFVKVIADERGKLIGGGIIGPHASDLIGELSVAVHNGLTLADVAGTVHAHPTLPEMVREACLDALGRPLHIPKGK